jgi:cytochrome c2
MGPRLSGALVFTLGLLAAGFAGGVGSLTTQWFQGKANARSAAHELTGGDPARGEDVFHQHACGACHAIRDVDQANGRTGPALDGVASRAFLAGGLPNDPPHMIAWVRRPQALQPGAGMPDMGLTEVQARDVAAYLYTLR